MELHATCDVPDVRNARVANSRLDAAGLSGRLFPDVRMSSLKIENAQVTGMTINGVSIRDLFAAYEAAQSAGGK